MMALIGQMLIDKKPSELHYFDDSKIFYSNLVPGKLLLGFFSLYHNKAVSFNVKMTKQLLVEYQGKKMAFVGRMLMDEKPSELQYFDDSKILYPDLVPGNLFGIFCGMYYKI